MAKEEANVSKDEQIGIHKGALSTLAKERQEFGRLLSIVEQLMRMHIEELKKLGVDLEKEAKKAASESAKKASKKSLEDDI